MRLSENCLRSFEVAD